MQSLKRIIGTSSFALFFMFSTIAMGQPLDLDRNVQPRVTDQQLTETESEYKTNRELIVDFLVSQGVDQEESEDRVFALSDDEVDRIVVDEGLDQQPVGQDSTVTIGVGTALLIGLLLLIL